LAALGLVIFAPASQAQVRRKILIINELGQSHPGPVLVTNTILSALHSDGRFQVEYYWENLDAVDLSEERLNEQRESLIQQYQHQKMDLAVSIGPHAIWLLEDPSKALFPDIPVVFCCAVPDQLGEHFRPDSRSTGSWMQLEPSRTVDAALRLLPETRQIFVVGGQSNYDRSLTEHVKAELLPYQNRLDISYLTGLPMDAVQERLRHLPSLSIVLYISFFKDAQGRDLLNAAEALPMVIATSNAPVFGMADTYLGRGIVGGFVVSFEEQGKIAARNALEILGGKPPQEIPIAQGPNKYMFDWRALQRWKLDERKLPAGSTILFREPTLWERHRLTALAGLLVIVSLAVLTTYLLYEQRQLNLARGAQEQLSGMLINAQEKERSRLAAEIHDDFSQRLAALTLGMETTAQIIQESPEEATRQLQELSSAASELGSDLHTLSHRLHSATLENLGLTPGVSAFCKEFSAQSGIKIESTLDRASRSVDPDVALCVFRIVQEGLRNVKKHSGASKAQVAMQLVDGTIHLSVCDQGAGFNPKELANNEGLGVRSMEERVRLLGGRFEIQSNAGMGTKIAVRLPVKKSKASSA
jgi:signal transduction histidine kinase